MRENNKNVVLSLETYVKLVMFKNKLYAKDNGLTYRTGKQIGFDEAVSIALTTADRILFSEESEQQQN